MCRCVCRLSWLRLCVTCTCVCLSVCILMSVCDVDRRVYVGVCVHVCVMSACQCVCFVLSYFCTGINSSF